MQYHVYSQALAFLPFSFPESATALRLTSHLSIVSVNNNHQCCETENTPVLPMTTIPTQKPLVVILGWLGSKPRNLLPYERLYQQLGFRVLCHTAAPAMIVESVLQPSLKDQIVSPPIPWTSLSASTPRSMSHLAWNILVECHQAHPSAILFHLLSNGGCFVWERIRHILDGTIQNAPKEQYTTELYHHNEKLDQCLQQVKNNIAGVVFDSCPGGQLDGIGKALQYCSWDDRIQATWAGGSDLFKLQYAGTSSSIYPQVQARSQEYLDSLRDDCWNLPQLYFCSEDDDLAPYLALESLVRHRQRIFGKDLIWMRSWQSSRHVSHLCQHPKNYAQTLESFVQRCLSDQSSKL